MLQQGDADYAVRFRVYERDGDEVLPTNRLSQVWGSKYSHVDCEAFDDPEEAWELPVYDLQLDAIEWSGPETQIYLVSAPGAGKTFTLTRIAGSLVAKRPNTCAGVVAPTSDRVDIVYDELKGLFEDLGWLLREDRVKKRLFTRNGCELQFVSAKKASKKLGSAVAGRSWDWALVDESQSCDESAIKDTLERGRRVGTSYRVYHSATMVVDDPHWDVRLDEAEHDPGIKVFRIPAPRNIFVDPSYWDIFRASYTDEEFRRRILCEKVDSPDKCYQEYSSSESVRTIPWDDPNWEHVTGELLRGWLAKIQHPLAAHSEHDVILGHDPGTLKSATIALRCFRHRTTGDRAWWVEREMVAYNYKTQDEHFRSVKRFYSPSQALVFWDPGKNGETATQKKEIQEEGFTVFNAALKAIERRRRVSMLKRLLQTSDGKRHLFLHTHEKMKTRVGPFKLAHALISMKAQDELHPGAKKNGDPTDLTSALAYGLARFENLYPPPPPPPGTLYPR